MMHHPVVVLETGKGSDVDNRRIGTSSKYQAVQREPSDARECLSGVAQSVPVLSHTERTAQVQVRAGKVRSPERAPHSLASSAVSQLSTSKQGPRAPRLRVKAKRASLQRAVRSGAWADHKSIARFSRAPMIRGRGWTAHLLRLAGRRDAWWDQRW